MRLSLGIRRICHDPLARVEADGLGPALTARTCGWHAGSKVAAATVTVGAPYSEVTFHLPGGAPLVLVKIPAGNDQVPASDGGR